MSLPPRQANPEAQRATLAGWRSDKIRPEHLDRSAIVYVRQSTMQQVLHNQESTRLQYGLQSRATDLGWSADRVVVVDDDQGMSGASAEGRAGFQRVVSEVALGNVGIIFGIEMSRLARSCKDWHQLLEACGLFGCLIADLDGIYDPSNYNDRLLLGLKGTMSEAELHIIKQRMLQGKLAKARRGELNFPLPIGYVRRPSGEIAQDPDEQVREVVRLVFHTFDDRRTLHATLCYLVDHGVQLGVRIRSGDAKGELAWNRPNRMTLQNMLRSPIYAGAYAYGRRLTDSRRRKAGRPSTGRTVTPREKWHALIHDHHPAYINWEQYEANLAQLRANRNVAGESGSPRAGSALLCGLLVCGKCGCQMSVTYKGRHTYACRQMQSNYGAASCQRVAGPPVDAFVVTCALEAMAPASLDLALEASRNVEDERLRLSDLWRRRLERAAFEAERAARQFRLVEPENRLVARRLETEWEARLGEQRALDEEHRRLEREHPRGLSSLEREAIRRLSADIPALWNASTTTQPERKEILRQVLDHVVINVQAQSERVEIEIQWAGGSRTQHSMVRPVARLEQLSYFGRLQRRVTELHARGLSAQAIADCLNAEDFKPPKRCERYSRSSVCDLVRRLGLGTFRTRRPESAPLGEHEWWFRDLADAIPIPPPTLYVWMKRGLVDARREMAKKPRWILKADPADLLRLRERRGRPAGYDSRRRWVDDEVQIPSRTSLTPTDVHTS